MGAQREPLVIVIDAARPCWLADGDEAVDRLVCTTDACPGRRYNLCAHDGSRAARRRLGRVQGEDTDHIPAVAGARPVLVVAGNDEGIGLRSATVVVDSH